MREQWKVFENYFENNLQNAEHAIFVIETSRQDKPRDTWDEIFEKFFQVFFATESSICEEFAKGATKIYV